LTPNEQICGPRNAPLWPALDPPAWTLPTSPTRAPALPPGNCFQEGRGLSSMPVLGRWVSWWLWGLLNWSCRTPGTTNFFGRSNFDPATASDSRPISLFLFPTWPLHDSIAAMSIGRHLRSWTTLMRASCRTRGTTNSFGPSNFDPRIASGSQPIFPFPRPTWPLPDSIALMSISRHRRPWKMSTTGALLSARALLPTRPRQELRRRRMRIEQMTSWQAP